MVPNGYGIDQVIETITNTWTTAVKATQTKPVLLNYYEVNRRRMRYKTFRDKGLLIGSGAMESAHRTVVQSRLKRSGQRWSIRGVQNVLNLRIINKSGHWSLIKNISLNSPKGPKDSFGGSLREKRIIVVQPHNEFRIEIK